MEQSLQNGLEDVRGCNEWNTCYEEKINTKTNVKSSERKVIKPTLLNDVKKQDIERTSTRILRIR